MAACGTDPQTDCRDLARASCDKLHTCDASIAVDTCVASFETAQRCDDVKGVHGFVDLCVVDLPDEECADVEAGNLTGNCKGISFLY